METYEVYDYIEKEIVKIPSDQDPITINEDPRWHELLDEAGDIFNKVVEKFSLRSVMIKGPFNTERGTELYYYIEYQLLSNFNIVDE